MMRALLLALVLLAPAVWAEASSAGPKQAAIASANEQATDAGLEVLRRGGNAFDAAVAVSAALGVVEPESSGLGGGGFFLLHIASESRDVFVDARERAPLAATRDMYLDADGKPDRDRAINGALAAAIPGLPAGLAHVAEKYGRLPLSASLAPAMRLARKGWTFGRKNAAMLQERRDAIAHDDEAARLFLPKGEIPAAGTRMRNPDYAATLQRLAEHGRDGFYSGELAARLVAGVRARGGIWSARDLIEYRVVEREPLRVTHRGFEIVTAPPPSSGGITLAAILNIMEGYDYAGMPRVERTHLLVEAMRRAYRDRAEYLGDPDFVAVPVALLTSRDYAAGLRAGIHPQRATSSAALPGFIGERERPDTTHFSIIDDEGNVAAVTQTVNLYYGAATVIPGTGFLLNNEMDDFSVQPGLPNAYGLVGAEANAIAAGKRPLSSMSPTFLRGHGRVAAIGTPGGSRIPTMVLLGLLQLMDGASAQAAVSMPRFHHQYLPDRVYIEDDVFTASEQAALRTRGFELEANTEVWGNMQVVLWQQADGSVETGNDPRWQGVGKGASTGSIYR